ncbi:hypothetical protein RRG08_055488 [Elysia crispata]|uniref:Uncharacterized protein n=1 Tax=Elysia crispata TaxID=231223 RepID=A0AAE0XQM5_9GAST|nr:hypothetical protein RRG08_055488 [Elysia crispata]
MKNSKHIMKITHSKVDHGTRHMEAGPWFMGSVRVFSVTKFVHISKDFIVSTSQIGMNRGGGREEIMFSPASAVISSWRAKLELSGLVSNPLATSAEFGQYRLGATTVIVEKESVNILRRLILKKDHGEKLEIWRTGPDVELFSSATKF